MENISVTGEFGRKPVLAFDGTPSDELVVEVLHAGDGQIVEAGDTITCHYYGAVFGSKNDFDNSFDRGGALSFQIGVGMVIPGGMRASWASAWATAFCCPSLPSLATASAVSRRPVSPAARPSCSSPTSSV